MRHGYHEARKDEFKPEYEAWNYAIRGLTIDKRELRVVVSFERMVAKSGEALLVITVIEVGNA